MVNDEVIAVDESLTMTFQDVKRDPDEVDVEDMTFENIKKMIQDYTKEKADLKNTIEKNLEKIQKLEREKEDCRNNLISKNQVLDVTKIKLKAMTNEKTNLTKSLEKVKSLGRKLTKENGDLTKKIAVLEETIATKDFHLKVWEALCENFKRDTKSENEILKSKLEECIKENDRLKALAHSTTEGHYFVARKRKIVTPGPQIAEVASIPEETFDDIPFAVRLDIG